MPSEKRSRQRANREAKQAAQAKSAGRRRLFRNGVVAVLVAAVVVGSIYLLTHRSSSKSTTTTTTQPASVAQTAANQAAVKAGCPENPDARANTLSWSSPPAMTIDQTQTYTATVETTVGTFVITMDGRVSPVSVNNFVFLAEHGFYHCNTFWRVIPGFMNQTGDPTSTGTGGPGYQFTEAGPPVATPQYPLGSVAMANSNNPPTANPNTNGSQFFIVAGAQGESLPPDYVLFGHVTSGMTVIDAINAQGSTANNGHPPRVTQRILKITITHAPTTSTTTTSSSTTTTTSSTTTTTTTPSTTTTSSTTTTTTPPSTTTTTTSPTTTTT